jgi:hypothetical protein
LLEVEEVVVVVLGKSEEMLDIPTEDKDQMVV